MRRVPLTGLIDEVFVDDNRYTIRHQTWSAPGVAVQAEKTEFKMTAVVTR